MSSVQLCYREKQYCKGKCQSEAVLKDKPSVDAEERRALLCKNGNIINGLVCVSM